MKLYHYVPKGSDVLKKGILSVSLMPEELLKYAKRAGSDKPQEIIAWLEKSCLGRSKSISVLTEPVKWQGNDAMLKDWVDGKELIEIDYTSLLQDGLIEILYCKDGSDKWGAVENIYAVSFEDIDFSPLPWYKCSKEKGLFFAVIRHYFIVMKNGIIPPQYIKLVSE